MSTTPPIRVGVIGTGFGGLVHLPGFQRAPGVQLVAVASGREERAREVGQQLGIPAYADYRRMLDEHDLDLVSITTPPYLHHEMALAAIERGRNVLCEKPLAANLAEAREMLAAAERAGVVHAVDHEFRYLPARLKMKELVDEGYLGELRTVRVTGLNDMWLSRPWGWVMEKSKSGGILQAQGSHLIDSLHWWFGPIVEVGAQLDTLEKSRPVHGTDEWRPCDAEDQVAALLRLANGALVHYLISGAVRPGQNRVEAYGSEGTLVIDEARLLGARGSDPLEQIDLSAALPKLEPGDDFRLAPFLAFLDRFLPQLRGERPPEVAGFREGVAVQAVMDAMRQSDVESRFVPVEQV